MTDAVTIVNAAGYLALCMPQIAAILAVKAHCQGFSRNFQECRTKCADHKVCPEHSPPVIVKFFQRVEGLVDEYMVTSPPSIPRAEEPLWTHQQLQEM